MSEMITGLWAAMTTPLDAEGKVDHAALVKHGQFLMQNGCDGLVPFGTTGEGTAFSAREKLVATEALLNSGVPALKIALGTGCPAIPDTVALTRDAMGLGLVHAMILPPYYYRDVTELGIEDAFAEIIEGVGSDRLRVCAYHIPQVSGVPTPAAALGRLRRRFGHIMAGVKDSTGDFDSFLAFRRAAPEIGALVGAETLIARARDEGGVGSICGMVNLVPHLVRAMMQGHEGTADMQAAVAALDAPFIPTMKAVLAAQTGDAAWRNVRAPFRPADPTRAARIAAALAAIGSQRAAE
ncbi:MAG: dihydrodipicolinate synthase family protein [Acetobacteraceae bacterium]|nr:dihydrodipicolinate synthase family protein [Acetobacteraceae bacterium]